MNPFGKALMSDTPTLIRTSATGKEIGEIIMRVDDVLDGVPMAHALMALISMILISMKPEITPQELQEKVQEVSQFIVLILHGAEVMNGPIVGDPNDPKITLN
jgi:hypothetical protein